MLNVTELWLHCYNKTNCLSEIQFFFFHVTLAIIVARTNQFQVEMQFSAHLNFQIDFGIFSRFWQFDQFLPIQIKKNNKKTDYSQCHLGWQKRTHWISDCFSALLSISMEMWQEHSSQHNKQHLNVRAKNRKIASLEIYGWPFFVHTEFRLDTENTLKWLAQ